MIANLQFSEKALVKRQHGTFVPGGFLTIMLTSCMCFNVKLRKIRLKRDLNQKTKSNLSVEQPRLRLERLCRAAPTLFCGGRLRIKGGRRQHSCSFHVQNRIPARLRRGSRREGGVWMQGNKTHLFDNDIKGDGSPLCLRHVWSELKAVKWSAKFFAAALWGWLSAAIRADLSKQLSAWRE